MSIDLIKSIALFSFIAIAGKASAQNCANEYWGTKTFYQPQQTKYAALPTGYQPVYINHVGRHGARHLTKDVAASLAYRLLQKADTAKALKPDGYRLKAMVMLLQKEEINSLKFISVRGAEEQQGIGSRMMANYPQVFKDKDCYTVAITKEERTKQSADAFLKGLSYNPSCKPEFMVNNDDLRFFSLAPAYLKFSDNGSWHKEYDKLESAVKPRNFDRQFLNHFFEASFIGTISTEQQDEFIDDVFGFSCIINSIQTEIVKLGNKPGDLNFRELISCSELKVLDELNCADDFLKKGPGMDNNGIQVRDAVPLLVSFINSTDNYIANHNLAASLRFAHAETIAPIAALMDISTADKPAKDILSFQDNWNAAAVIPLSSNIQWVLYKNVSGNYLIKIMLNEKEAAIDGITTKTFPYYQWTDLRAHYMDKLNKLNVKLTDNMHAYLLNLK